MNSEPESLAFHARLDTLINGEEPFAWARRMGIPSATFARMRKEMSVPRWQHLIKIAQRSNVSVDWLLTGQREVLMERDQALPQQADEDLAFLIADGVSKIYKAIGGAISPGDLGRIVARLYTDAMIFNDPAQRPAFVAGALGMLRRELQAPVKPGKSKRSA